MTRFVAAFLFATGAIFVHPLAAELGQAVGLAAVKDPAKLGFDAEKLDAVFAAQIVRRQHPGAMRINAPQIGFDHIAYSDLYNVFRHAPGTIDFGDLLA